MTGIYLLLGSNLGDKVRHLAVAGELIGDRFGTILLKSSLFHSEPWGMSDAPTFLNQVLLVSCSLQPLVILDEILKLEIDLGRTRQVGYQNRTIDVDLLYYGSLVFEHPDLTIPHPRISERRFVLEPLVEISPNFVHPVYGLTNQQLLDQCSDSLSVARE